MNCIIQVVNGDHWPHLPYHHYANVLNLDPKNGHSLQPTFIDRAVRKSLVTAKVAAAKTHSDDDKKCHRNGLRLIVMA
jgi:hypothetical protein